MLPKRRTIYLLSLLSFFVLGACKATQGSNASDVIRIDQVPIDEADEQLVSADTAKADTLNMDTIKVTDEIQLTKKASYRVAVILPYQADSVRKAWDLSSVKNFENFAIDPASELALSFTEGLLMAINDAQFSSKIELKFFDDQNDPLAIQSIVNQLKIDSFDLIIGPELKTNLQSIAAFAKAEGIAHVSPFSPSKSASADNPAYFMVEPSLDQHILTMLHFTLDSIEKPHIQFIHEQNSFGNYYANLASNYLDTWNDTLPEESKVAYTMIGLGSDMIESEFQLAEHMDAEANNVFICNTFNDNFLTHFLPQIQRVKEEQDLLVFGMPGWEKSATLRLDYLNTGEVHFTSAVLNTSDTAQNFIVRYEDKYKSKPSQAVYLGYEMSSIFLNQLDEFGIGYYDNLIDKTLNPINRKYHFIEVLDENGQVSRVENTALLIYKIQNFEQVQVR
jgi:hypothetical protein